jgi:hypothetical protein
MSNQGRCWVFATDHKTGTVWQMNMSRAFSQELGSHVDWVSYRENPSVESTPDRDYVVFFERSYLCPQSRWPDHPHLRGIRMVRDPRDVIISGAEYHARGIEAWLHEPDERFNGLSYSEALQALESRVDRLRFEMRNCATETIREMARLSDPRLLIVRYEDLFSWETAKDYLIEISDWLELNESESEALLRAHSLTHLENQSSENCHATRGVRARWSDEWPRELDEEFINRFSRELPNLPYQLPTYESLGLEIAPPKM